MRLFGLIGYPLGHSFSKRYFTEKFGRENIADARYELFPLEQISGLPALLDAHPELCGLNVTIPHKEQVLPYLDALDDTARAVGAVNCIRIDNGRLTGYNTDVTGFRESLLAWPAFQAAFLQKPAGESFILGTGGASKAVAHVLQSLGLSFRFVSRSPAGAGQMSYEALAATLSRQLSPPSRFFINTTPLGMAPHTEAWPELPFHLLQPQDLVYDLIYNPVETVLLQRAKTQGCAIKNGLEMLHLQAEAAWRVWNS
jgi:shikimate dehydrogenase